LKVKVRLFALYREMVGQKQIEVDMEPGATVACLVERVSQRFPQFQPKALLAAVNGQYVDLEHPLHPGDEVAFLPPVSGGDNFMLTPEPISPDQVIAQVHKPDHGAVVTFVGTVRNQAEGKRVLCLEFEAYGEMAEQRMREIAEEIRKRWGVADVAIWHRTGRVEVGDIILVIAVGAPHRAQAFAACHYAIDRLKVVVPIWKKEVREDGEVWVGPEGHGEKEG